MRSPQKSSFLIEQRKWPADFLFHSLTVPVCSKLSSQGGTGPEAEWEEIRVYTHCFISPTITYCHGLHFSKLDAECSSKVTHSLPRAKATAGKHLSRPLAPFPSVHLTVAPILPSRMSEVSLSLGVNPSVYGCVHSTGSVSACCTECYSLPFRKIRIFDNWKRRESTH